MNREENPQSKRKHQRSEGITWTTSERNKPDRRATDRSRNRSPSQVESRRHSRGSR